MHGSRRWIGVLLAAALAVALPAMPARAAAGCDFDPLYDVWGSVHAVNHRGDVLLIDNFTSQSLLWQRGRGAIPLPVSGRGLDGAGRVYGDTRRDVLRWDTDRLDVLAHDAYFVAVNSTGQVLVHTHPPQGVGDTVLIDRGRATTIRGPDGRPVDAFAISDGGAVVAFRREENNGIRHVYLWQHGGVVELTRRDNTAQVTFQGVNASGDVIATLTPGEGSRSTSVLWSQGRTIPLLTAAGLPFWALAINDRGEVAGVAPGSQVVRWSAGRITSSVTIENSFLVAMNNHGDLVVGTYQMSPDDLPDTGTVEVVPNGRRASLLRASGGDPPLHVWITDGATVVYNTFWTDHSRESVVDVSMMRCSP
jgi:hypothetical protein